MDILFSYTKKKWISLKWILSSGILSRLRVLLAHPHQICRDTALHIVVTLVGRGRNYAFNASKI